MVAVVSAPKTNKIQDKHANEAPKTNKKTLEKHAKPQQNKRDKHANSMPEQTRQTRTTRQHPTRQTRGCHCTRQSDPRFPKPKSGKGIVTPPLQSLFYILSSNLREQIGCLAPQLLTHTKQNLYDVEKMSYLNLSPHSPTFI